MPSRRKFLINSGSALLGISFSASCPLVAALQNDQNQLPALIRKNRQIDAWLEFSEPGIVTLYSGKSELGQGVLTAFAQIVAEELWVGISQIDVISVDTERSPDMGLTAGSMSIEQGCTALRLVAAEARRQLLERAAESLGVNPLQVSADGGQIRYLDRNTELNYWTLLEDHGFNPAQFSPANMDARETRKIRETSVARIDIPKKVFGQPAFIQDMRFMDMLHARVVRPPNPGARLNRVNSLPPEMSALGTVVRDGSFLAVVANQESDAQQLAEYLRSESQWSGGSPLPNQQQLSHWLKAKARPAQFVVSKGSPAVTRQVSVHQASYTRPFQAHASLSPSIAIAYREPDKLTIWSHAQGMYPLRGAIAKVVGLPESKVRCIHAENSGCYGHNGADDAACDAALIAMQWPGRHIRMQYSRADEFLWEPYGSAMVMQVEASLDEKGTIIDWRYDVWSCAHSTRPMGSSKAGNLYSANLLENPVPRPVPRPLPRPRGGADRNSVPIYALGGLTIRRHFVPEMPIRVSALRTLGAYANVFAIESFMDELANAAGIDPIAFRIKHLQDPRAIELLERLKQITHWTEANAVVSDQANYVFGRGVGLARYKNSAAYCAVAFHIGVDRKLGRIQLIKAFAVVDAGEVISPDGVINQIEGGIIQAASWTLKEQIRFDSQQITTRSWADYPVLTFSEAPELEVHLLQRPNLPPLGVGEAAAGPAGAALGNALANAIAGRVRDIPLTPDKVIAAVRQSKKS